MSLRRNKTPVYAAVLAGCAVLSGCGQSIRGELPDPDAAVSSVLTPAEARAAADALVKAKAERQTADASGVRTEGGDTH